MANRFPLVLDTGDGNKIKELPSGDNLNLRESSIVNVQDVTALGTINAADIRVNGNRLVAQSFADLTDTPNSFAGAANYFVKVKEDGTGLEFRPFSDIGNIEVETITVSEDILPATSNQGSVGTDIQKFQRVTANELKGSLLSFDGSTIFNANTGFISYAALQGAPQFLSEFTDDIGFLRTSDLDDAIGGLFDEGVPFATDIKGSVFGDDSTILVDGINGKIVGEVDTFVINTSILTSQEGLGNITITGGINDFGGSVNIIGGSGTFERGGSVSINGGNGVTVDGFVNIGQSSDEVRIDGNNLFIGTVVGDINLGRAGATTTAFGTVDLTNAIVIGSLDGELIGSVFYDDSTQIIDAVAGRIVNPIIQGSATFENNVTVDQDLTVLGNLIVQGTTTSIETTNTTITDNIIVLNEGESGAGVTAGTSGIEIDRGSETNKTLVWDESVDKWTVGAETFVANTVEAIAFSGSLFTNGGANTPLQIFSGQQGQTGNTIFINPYGSDTFLIQQAETIFLRTGPYLSDGNPYIQFTTAGAFEAHDGAYFEGDLTGNVTGDIKGSVFGDDSTPLVDSVANLIRGDLASTRWTTDGYTNITVNGFLEMRPQFFQLNTQADGYMQFNAGDGDQFGAGYMQFNAGDGGSSTSGFGGYIQINAGNGSGSNAGGGGYIQIEAGNGSGLGSLGGGYINISAGNAGGGDLSGGYTSISAGDSSGNEVGAYTQISAGDAENAAGGEVRIYGGTSLNGNGGDVVIEGGFGGSGTNGNVRILNAEITGNIDNTTLNIGTTTATAINIGNENSAIVMDGTLQLNSALIVNNLIADDSFTITTAVGDGNAITIGPQGTNRIINLVSDNIRFFGPITTEIIANGGVTGDITGSVFGDDSTVLVDGVNSSINLNGTVKGDIIPDTNIAYDLGSDTNRFRDLYLSGSTINMGGATISVNPSTGQFTLPINTSTSLGLPRAVGLTGFYGLSPDFSENQHPVDPNNSVPIAPDLDLDQAIGPIFAYSKVVFDPPIPGYGAGIEYNYGNFPAITGDGATPPTIVADIDGGGNLLSLEITDPGNATGRGDGLLFSPLGDPGSFNGGQIGLQDNADSAPIVTAQGGTITGNVTGNVTGTVTGDLKGSVFADDSSVMVDAVNFTMLANVMTLTPLNNEPTPLIAGMLAAADGTNWDPASKSGAVPYPVFYDGVAWNALY